MQFTVLVNGQRLTGQRRSTVNAIFEHFGFGQNSKSASVRRRNRSGDSNLALIPIVVPKTSYQSLYQHQPHTQDKIYVVRPTMPTSTERNRQFIITGMNYNEYNREELISTHLSALSHLSPSHCLSLISQHTTLSALCALKAP